MAYEPINVFSHRIDPRGVITVLRNFGKDVRVVGPEDDWESVVVTFRDGGIFRKARVLTFGHDSSYYDGDGWQGQVLGMQGYFSEFPDCPFKADVLRAIGTFRFALSVPQHDLDVHSQDDRLAALYAVCLHLDGVIFTPSALRDASGRVLLDSRGYSDPAARPPILPEIESGEPYSEEDAGETDVSPPTADRIARRTLALTAVAARATLELDGPHLDNPDEQRLGILSWIEEIGIGNELEPDEWKVLQRPVGSLDERAFVNAMWRVEGLVVLAWSLHLYPLPPDDELVFPPDLYRAIGLFDVEAARSLLKSPRVRDTAELKEMFTHLVMLHWRLRNYALRPGAMDFVAFSRDCWIGSFDITKFRIIKGDLAIGRFPIHRAPKGDVQNAHSIAMERHLAINWLLGDSEIYSKTDTST